MILFVCCLAMRCIFLAFAFSPVSNFKGKLVCSKLCWHWNKNNDVCVFCATFFLPRTTVYVALGQMTKCTYKQAGNLHIACSAPHRIEFPSFASAYLIKFARKYKKEMSAWNFKWFYYYFFFACFNKWLAVSEFHLNCRYFEVQDEVRSTNTRNWHGLKSSRNNWLAYFKQKATHKPVKFTHARLLAHTHTHNR